MRAAIFLVALLALTGCKDDRPQPPVTIVDRTPARLDIPRECWTADPEWLELPDREVRLKETARNYDENRSRFRAIRNARAVCRAAIGSYGYGKQ